MLTSYIHPFSGESSIIIFNEDIIFGDILKSFLIDSNKIRAHGATVSDVPKKFDKTSYYSIVGVDDKKGRAIILPICLRGIISYLPTIFLIDKQIKTYSYITLTSAEPWDPYSISVEIAEDR